MKQSHIRNVVYVDLRFKDNDKSFPVELDGEYRGGKQQFANHGLSLRGGRSPAPIRQRFMWTHLGVDDLQLPWARLGLIRCTHQRD